MHSLPLRSEYTYELLSHPAKDPEVTRISIQLAMRGPTFQVDSSADYYGGDKADVELYDEYGTSVSGTLEGGDGKQAIGSSRYYEYIPEVKASMKKPAWLRLHQGGNDAVCIAAVGVHVGGNFDHPYVIFGDVASRCEWDMFRQPGYNIRLHETGLRSDIKAGDPVLDKDLDEGGGGLTEHTPAW